VKLGVHKLTGQEVILRLLSHRCCTDFCCNFHFITQVAIKVVDRIHAPSVVREIETWRHLHHPNVAQLYEVLVTENKIYMVTELCTGGEAFDYIVEHGRLNDRAPETRKIFNQVVEAVQYCHAKNFVHRYVPCELIVTTEILVT
jgi:serine/threonine protein kinase